LEKKINLPPMKWILPILVIFVIAQAVFANGLGGQRLEKVVGDLIVDIGTDQASTPIAGDPIEFDFNLLDSATGEAVTTTSVGLDIGHNGKSMVNCDLTTQDPTTFLIYAFPEKGSYTLKVQFFDKDRSLATASFPLTISGSTDKWQALYIAALIASPILGYWSVTALKARLASRAKSNH
jgi:hypothetical protein